PQALDGERLRVRPPGRRVRARRRPRLPGVRVARGRRRHRQRRAQLAGRQHALRRREGFGSGPRGRPLRDRGDDPAPPARAQLEMTVEILEFESRVLRGNPLGDPPLRRTPVYLPPSYPRQRYPVLFMLTGFTGFGEMMVQRQAWSESLPERLDRLIRTKKMGEAIVVMPDCFTRLGGSQYVNSSATGRYEDHVVRELVPYIDARYRT